MNLIMAVTFPRDGLAFAQTHFPLEGLHGDHARVEVRGDDRAQYGSVAKVLARIKAAGIPVTLVTEAAEGNKAQ